MKLLTETEQGHFQGTLTGLSLPPKAALYISHGLPTVFQLAEPSARSQSLGLWLHIPYEQLASVRHRLAVETSDPQPNHVADCCLEADDLNLYPVLVAGEIRAVIATDRETTFAPDRGGGGDIVESLSGRYGRSGLDDSLVTREFLRCLFDRDRSFDEFQRAMLNLVTSQWPRSLGALYFESEGVFKLRLAVGDIHLSDRLEGTLSPQRARSWTGAVREQRYFTSADMMPDYPVVLDHAPNYVFVHPGIQSERTEYLVALLMSGDIGAEQVRAVMQIARMTGYLHEAQFSTTAETVSLYGCLQELPTSNNRFRELLGKVFEVVGRQIDLSRLVVGDVGGSATVLVNQGEERPIFRSEPSPPIPTEVLHSLSPEEPVMVPEVATDPRHEGVTNGYSADRVASEIIFGTGLAGSIQGYVAFGSSLTGEHLDRYRDFFIAISRFVRLTRQLMASRPNDTLIGAPKKTIESDTMARDRLDTIAKLAGGYFHDIMEYLSVVVGQNELIESEAADTMAVEKGAIRVRKAADRIADYLDKLRSLCMLTTDQLGRRLSVRCFLEDLPTIVQGYARQIRDNKNVVLTIDTEHPGDTDFEITWQELYDWVLPLVLGIMDEAICSGPLTVRTESVEGRPGMAFEFPASIIGHTNSGELIGRIYAHWSGERSGEQQGSVRFRGMALSFGPGAKDSCLVRIQPTEKPKTGQPEMERSSDGGEGMRK